MISTGVDSGDLNIPYKTLGEILLRMFCRVEEGPTGSEQLRRHTSNLKGDWKAPWGGESWIPRVASWLNSLQGGGNSNMFYFHPYLGKMNPFLRSYFAKGLVQPPTSLPHLVGPQDVSCLCLLSFINFVPFFATKEDCKFSLLLGSTSAINVICKKSYSWGASPLTAGWWKGCCGGPGKPRLDLSNISIILLKCLFDCFVPVKYDFSCLFGALLLIIFQGNPFLQWQSPKDSIPSFFRNGTYFTLPKMEEAANALKAYCEEWQISLPKVNSRTLPGHHPPRQSCKLYWSRSFCALKRFDTLRINMLFTFLVLSDFEAFGLPKI